jgi:lysylphosphatidylglycerol synthetase-like protein (DUF2156 family)
MKKTIILLFLLLIPLSVHGLNLTYPTLGPGEGIDLNKANLKFSEFIIWLYYLIVIIASAAAFVIIIWGGIEYLTSAGNPSRRQSGLNWIKDALIGLVIVLIAYVVLQTISPRLVEVPDLVVPDDPTGQLPVKITFLS